MVKTANYLKKKNICGFPLCMFKTIIFIGYIRNVICALGTLFLTLNFCVDFYNYKEQEMFCVYGKTFSWTVI